MPPHDLPSKPAGPADRFKDSGQRLLLPGLSFTLLLGLWWIIRPWIEPALDGQPPPPSQWLAFGLEIGLWLCGAVLAARLVDLALWDGLLHGVFDGRVPQYLRDVVRGFVFAVVLALMLVHVLQLPVGGVWATSGVIGIVLGLALRNIILDLFTGLTLNIERPFVIGDWVMLQDDGARSNLAGWVTEINWRTTRIVTRDRVSVIVPNNFFGDRIVSNYSQPEQYARFCLRLRLDYALAPERALRILLAGVRGAIGQPRGPLENPAPDVLIAGMDERGIEYLIRYWIMPSQVSEPEAANTVWRSLVHHLNHAGLSPACPRQDVFHAPRPPRSSVLNAPADIERLLTQTVLFNSLNEEEIRLIAEHARPGNYREGSVLVREGESGDSMFLLVEGTLHVLLEARGDRPRIRLAMLRPGDFFGEISLLTCEPRSATVMAVTDCLVYEITKEGMQPILSQRPEVGAALSMAVAERRLRLSTALANASPEQRIAETGSLAQQILGKMWSYFGLARAGNPIRQ